MSFFGPMGIGTDDSAPDLSGAVKWSSNAPLSSVGPKAGWTEVKVPGAVAYRAKNGKLYVDGAGSDFAKDVTSKGGGPQAMMQALVKRVR